MPPLNNWFSPISLFLAVAFAFNLAVALIGIRETMSEKNFYTLVVIGAFLTVASLWVAAKQQQESDELRTQVVGGSHYATILGEITNPFNVTAPLPLTLLNSGKLPQLDVTLRISKYAATAAEAAQAWQSQQQIIVGNVLIGERRLGLSLPIGKWDIDIQTRGGAFREFLTIGVRDYQGQPTFTQEYVIKRNTGETVFDSNNPAP